MAAFLEQLIMFYRKLKQLQIENKKQKEMKFLSLIILALNYSCGNMPNDMMFKEYIILFEEKEVPYSLDSSFIRSTTETKIDPLDTAAITYFFEANRKLGGGVNLFDVYRYYPHFKFSINNNFIAVIIEKVGGAGGVEKMFYLVIYHNNGEITDKTLLAKEIGDCSMLQLWTGEITKDFEFHITQKLFKGDCDTDTYSLANFQKESYKLTKTGLLTTDF